MRNDLLSAWILLAGAPAMAFDLNCPGTLNVTLKTAQPASGWASWFRDPIGHAADPSVSEVVVAMPVDQVELYSGLPGADNADDIPPKGGYGEGAAGRNHSWDIASVTVPGKPLYAACRYGPSMVRLVRPLPDNLIRCRSRYDGNGPRLTLHCDEARNPPPP